MPDPLKEGLKPVLEPVEYSAGDLKQYLRNNSYIDLDEVHRDKILDSLNIAETAAKDAVGDIHLWVRKNISSKSLNVKFASAKETLNLRSGDCSEHAIPTVALLRATHIPARLVYGVVFSDDAFWFHYWVEYWRNGWKSLDPTTEFGRLNTRYIKFTDCSLNDMNETQVGLMVSSYTNIKFIEVLESH